MASLHAASVLSPITRWLGLAAVAAPLMAAPAQAQTVRRNIAYGSDSPAQVLDIYEPAAMPAPLVIFVHGGGWTRGDKNAGARVANVLAQEGYVVASVDYRLVPEGTMADGASDVTRAAAYLLAHSAEFGIDPAGFALLGHSAGGHLVALAATDPSYAQRSGLDLHKLRAVITLDGVFDLKSMPVPPDLQGRINANAASRRAMSPIEHLDSMQIRPLFCVVHEDTQRRFMEQAQAFTAALRQRSIPVSEGVAPGLNHGEMVSRYNDPSQPVAGLVQACLRKAF